VSNLKEQKNHELWLIEQLKESAQNVIRLVAKLNQEKIGSDDALTIYSDLMAKTLQLELDAEDVLKSNREITILELEEDFELAQQ